MLPHSYEFPVVFLLLAGGFVACFAGYRLFRVVLAIYGFLVGAMLASSMMGATNTFGMVAAALGGGLVGAVVLTFAYFVGIALVGAGFGALVVNIVWSRLFHVDPPALVVIAVCVLGAIGAMVVQRYVIVGATAFGGAWTMVVGALALQSAGVAQPGGDVWILYPFTTGADRRNAMIAWIALGGVGAIVQLTVTSRRRK